MSETIKPCPFCGAEVDASVPYAAAVVHKPSCFFRKVPHGKRGVHGFGEHTPPEAIEAWNKRADNSWMADEYELDHGTITAVVIGGTRYVKEGA